MIQEEEKADESPLGKRSKRSSKVCSPDPKTNKRVLKAKTKTAEFDAKEEVSTPESSKISVR